MCDRSGVNLFQGLKDLEKAKSKGILFENIIIFFIYSFQKNIQHITKILHLDKKASHANHYNKLPLSFKSDNKILSCFIFGVGSRYRLWRVALPAFLPKRFGQRYSI